MSGDNGSSTARAGAAGIAITGTGSMCKALAVGVLEESGSDLISHWHPFLEAFSAMAFFLAQQLVGSFGAVGLCIPHASPHWPEAQRAETTRAGAILPKLSKAAIKKVSIIDRRSRRRKPLQDNA